MKRNVSIVKLYFACILLAFYHHHDVTAWILQARTKTQQHYGSVLPSSLLQLSSLPNSNQPNNNNNNNDKEEEEEASTSSLEELFLSEFDENMMILDDDDFIMFDTDGPEVFLNEEDLSQLYYDERDHNNNNIINLNSTLPMFNLSSSSSSLSLMTSELSYFYLRDELGLSEDVMWRITNDAGSVLGMKASTVRNKVEVLREAMNLSDDNLRDLITSFPPILHLGAKTNLSPTILLLLRRLELGRNELKAIVLGCPALLGYSRSNLHRKISFFTNTMGYSVDQTREIILQEPRILTSSVNTMLSRYQFLMKEIQMQPKNLCKIVQKNPKILMMSVEKNLQPKLVFYFIMTLYMKPEEVEKLLLSYPLVLNYSLENHLQPLTRYFLSLDVSAYEFARMLLRFPRLLTYSLVKMKRIVGYLRFELGLQAHDVRRVLYQAPQVISLTMDTLQNKVDFLVEAAKAPGQQVDKTSEDSYATRRNILRKLVVGMPSLLHLSVEKNLKPKVEYLERVLGKEKLASALERFPTMLGYSLDNRIKPRLEQILAAGIDGEKLTVGLPMKQEAFEEWLERRSQKLSAVQIRNNDDAPNKEKTSLGSIITSDKVLEKEKKDQRGRIVENEGRVVHWIRRS